MNERATPRRSRPAVPPEKRFADLFDGTARYHHRRDVFRDFVFASAVALRNRVTYDQELENEYLRTIRRYEPEDQTRFRELFGLLVEALDPAPRDVLGQIYMDLEMGNDRQGQFFTPAPISDLMARMIHGDDLDRALEEKPFITVSEPACGAGGMILSVVGSMIEKGEDPARRLWVQATDVDRTAALMCYTQLSLWNVPAEVIVGDVLTMEAREAWKTPAHVMFGWDAKLAAQRAGPADDPAP